MKVARIIGKSLKVAAWTVTGMLLTVAAALLLLYSPWSQRMLCRYINATMNDGPITVSLDRLELNFPLELHLSNFTMSLDGIERIHTDRLDANVAVRPLLDGNVQLRDTRAFDADLIMGHADSAMYLTINADSLMLNDAVMRLSDMHIDIVDGDIAHARVGMLLNPVESPADTAKSEPSTMQVALHTMRLRDLSYTMRMLPTIDTLSTHIEAATLTNGLIDLAGQRINLGGLTGDRMSVRYIAPDAATIAATPVIEPKTDDTPTKPWTIGIDTIGFTNSDALYTTRGIEPLPGMDFGYIAVDSLTLAIHDFYNCASTVRVPLEVSGRERCGVELHTSGLLDVDTTGTALRQFYLTTANGTDLDFNFFLGMGDLTSEPSTPLSIVAEGRVAPTDLTLMFPDFGGYLGALPRTSAINARADVNGTAGRLNVRDLVVAIAGMADLKARGSVSNAFAASGLGCDIDFSGNIAKLIPRTSFDGSVILDSREFSATLDAATCGGTATLYADWGRRYDDYDVTLGIDNLNIDQIMPSLELGTITADVDASGRGFDLTNEATELVANIAVGHAVYKGYDYSGISANAVVADGMASATLHSDNPSALFDLNAEGNLTGDTYSWTMDLTDVKADLKALNLADAKADLTGALTASAEYSKVDRTLAGQVTLNALRYTTDLGTTRLDDVLARINANDSVTILSVHNRDFFTFLSSEASLDTIMTRLGRVSDVIAGQVEHRTVDVEQLQRALPPFVLNVRAGRNNAITDILAESRMGFRDLHLMAANDSSLTINGTMRGFFTQDMKIDTASIELAQYGPRMIITGKIDNRPGTFDQWAHVRLDGYIADNILGLSMQQRNIRDEEGYNVGARIELADSIVSLVFDPTDPTIAYKPWTINDDNFVTWSFAHNHIDANLHMHGPTSSLNVYTNHIEGEDEHQEALIVDIADIEIADWVNINPFAPPMSGTLSANFQLNRDEDNISGDGSVTLAELKYNKERVGTVNADLNVSTSTTGRVRASAGIAIDDVKTITLAGALNDSTAGSPLALDFSMIHFPLTAVNPFLPEGVARLSGTLNGMMDITGTATAPTLNGWLQFDETAIKVDMVGTTYPVSNVRIPVVDNLVTFKDFAISGVNDVPLALNGIVDIHSTTSPQVDLALTTDNFQLCDTKRAARGADIYGKAFLDVNTTVKGNMEFMAVNANLNIRPGTNVTYVMSDAQSAIQSYETDGLVKFTNFTDTTSSLRLDTVRESAMALLLQASLSIQNGSTINVDLSPDGQNKVRLLPEGTLNFSMPPFSDARITGRLNINDGFARYTPPLLGEKMFTFSEGSYIAFNGEMMNPTLNLRAVDQIKANVTQSGQNSRIVDFDVSLAVTGTLNNMNVVFDLSTDDDVTVANELQSMSAEQRANQAMNMLLYNVYTGPGTSGNANLSGNMLYSFLTSQLNSWAAKTIKGVDLSFGVDQYDRTLNGSTSTTTSYSYQVSKSLFNDRFKIVVGGNYSTDANADENFSQNLIKDISFEYYINDARTMYVRLFRHSGYESILEGEITRTGVGFVFKRKLVTLRNLFSPFGRIIKKSSADKPAQTTSANESN